MPSCASYWEVFGAVASMPAYRSSPDSVCRLWNATCAYLTRLPSAIALLALPLDSVLLVVLFPPSLLTHYVSDSFPLVHVLLSPSLNVNLVVRFVDPARPPASLLPAYPATSLPSRPRSSWCVGFFSEGKFWHNVLSCLTLPPGALTALRAAFAVIFAASPLPGSSCSGLRPPPSMPLLAHGLSGPVRLLPTSGSTF